MKNKLFFLTKMSLKKKVCSKWFIIINIVLAVALIGMLNIDSIISFFGGSFNDQVKIVVIDNTTNAYTYFDNNLKTLKETVNKDDVSIEVTKTEEKEETVKESLKKNNNILIVFNDDQEAFIKAKVISNENIDPLNYQIINQALTTTKTQIALIKSNIDQTELAKASSPISIERIILDNTTSNQDENMNTIMGTVFPTVILPFFMLTLFLVQMIGAEICEEKTTRSMEIILSNVSPRTHLFSKVIAANLFVIIQGLLLIGYTILGLLIKNLIGNLGNVSEITNAISTVWKTLADTGFLDKLIYIIPLTLVLMLLTFFAYSLVAGILASMTVTMEDFQQLQTPIILVSLVGYYLAMMAGMFNGSIFIRVLSYVPFLSSLVSPALLILGQISIIDVIISISVMILFNFIVLKYGLKIYKIGILNYSNEKVWKRFFKAVNSKDI